MALIDIDSREIADFKDVEYFPRAYVRSTCKLVKFDAFETEKGSGWFAEFDVEDAEILKEDPNFEPPPVEGRRYQTGWKRVGVKYPEEAARNMRALFTFLAACDGKEATPEFKASPVRDKLMALNKAGKLEDVGIRFVIERTCTPKAGKKGTEHEHKIFVNTKDRFMVAE